MTMTAKFNGRCKRCGGFLPQGSAIEWTKDGGATHVTPQACEVTTMMTVEVTANATPIVAFLTAAQARGLKFPKARFLAPGGGELRLSIAGETSKYPGSIQVKVDAEWRGRIEPNGNVAGPLKTDRTLLAALDTIAEDPAGAAKAYGALMGRCSFCDIKLTDEGSVEAGYGPICAERYGLAHTAKGRKAVAEVPALVLA